MQIINKSYFKLLKTLNDGKDRNLRDLSRDTGLDMARISPIMREWGQEKIIKREEIDGGLKLTITAKGSKICNYLIDIDNELKEIKPNKNMVPQNKKNYGTTKEKSNDRRKE